MATGCLTKHRAFQQQLQEAQVFLLMKVSSCLTLKRRFGSSMKNLAASMSMGSNILVLMHDALVCHCPCLSLFRELLLVHAAPQHKRWCSAGCALTLAVDSELELNAVASGAFRCCYLLFAPV